VVVMPDGVLVPPLPHPLVPLTQPIVQRRKEIDSHRSSYDVESHA
jgi:hypothetical protein